MSEEAGEDLHRELVSVGENECVSGLIPAKVALVLGVGEQMPKLGDESRLFARVRRFGCSGDLLNCRQRGRRVRLDRRQRGQWGFVRRWPGMANEKRRKGWRRVVLWAEVWLLLDLLLSIVRSPSDEVLNVARSVRSVGRVLLRQWRPLIRPLRLLLRLSGLLLLAILRRQWLDKIG